MRDATRRPICEPQIGTALLARRPWHRMALNRERAPCAVTRDYRSASGAALPGAFFLQQPAELFSAQR